TGHFLFRRCTIVRWSTSDYVLPVEFIDPFLRQAFTKVLSGSTYKRFAFIIFISSWPFTYRHDPDVTWFNREAERHPWGAKDWPLLLQSTGIATFEFDERHLE